jgi:TPR repeat protein
MRHLAENENYPEAICDLAQFYEYGIQTPKDLKKAERLYKEAMHRGIRRAERHYMRLHKKNRGLFSFLRR